MDSVGMSPKWAIRQGTRVEFEALTADICSCFAQVFPDAGYFVEFTKCSSVLHDAPTLLFNAQTR